MTVLPRSPTVKGFTVNNLRGSVRYWNRPPTGALGSLPSSSRDGGATADGLTHARRLARRLAYIASVRDGPGGSLVSLRRDGSVREGPGVLPDSLLVWVRLGGWFGACPAAT